MAGVTRTLKAGLIFLAVLLGTSAPAVANPLAETSRQSVWYSPAPLDGKTFPILYSAEGRWLNWRDTYGAPRMRQQPNGVWKQTGTHQGIDIFTERGAPVVSMTPGTVEQAGWTFYSGWRIGVRGTDGRYYFYAHLLQDFATGIAEGGQVRAGQLLGRVGSSGYGPVGTSDEFPPHLHFGIQAGTRWQNPEPVLRKLSLHTITSVKDLQRRVEQVDGAVRVLRARAQLPAAPGATDLASRIAELANQRREILRQATMLM